MNPLEKFNLRRHINKRIIFAMIIFGLATISIAISQNKDTQIDELQNNRTEQLLASLGVKLSFTEIKVSMNEYLLRYLASDIPTKYENNDFLVTQAVPSKPVSIYQFNPNLTSWFDAETNVQWYFGDVGNLNSVRPQWDDSEADFLDYLLGRNKDIEDKIMINKYWRDFFRNLSYLLNILGIMILLMALKPKNKEIK